MAAPLFRLLRPRCWEVTGTCWQVILPDDKRAYRIVHQAHPERWSRRRFRRLELALAHASALSELETLPL